jgi:hypothetical protein
LAQSQTFLQQTKFTMMKKNKKVQASTLKTMPMSSPTGGGRVPRGFHPYDGTAKGRGDRSTKVSISKGWEQPIQGRCIQYKRLQSV